jgi:L-aspartate oxidase
VTEYCRSAGIEPARDLIPVAPAAHYHMGGVLTDANGRTTLDGLWAAGEVASTGAHGANRLASNSLLEAVVYAARVADDIAGLLPLAQTRAWPAAKTSGAEPTSLAEPAREQALRQLMAQHVGVIRNGEGLAYAVREIAATERACAQMPGMRNMATTALMIAAAALRRKESRGGHYRSDFPKTDPAQARRTYLTLAQARAIAASTDIVAAPELAPA